MNFAVSQSHHCFLDQLKMANFSLTMLMLLHNNHLRDACRLTLINTCLSSTKLRSLSPVSTNEEGNILKLRGLFGNVGSFVHICLPGFECVTEVRKSHFFVFAIKAYTLLF